MSLTNKFLFLAALVWGLTIQHAKAVDFYSERSGIVIGVLYSSIPYVLVRVPGNNDPLIVRLQDVELPDENTSDLAASVSSICAMICHKRITWDTLSQGDDGSLAAYAYLGEKWVNDEVIRLGYASASPSPVHPALMH
jgi:hypothetical protein